MTLLQYIEKNLPRSVFCVTEDKDDLVGLPYPYTVPSPDEMFREMYYWDTYFTNVGLIAIGNIRQAKNNADNVAFLVNKIGYMPNSNRAHHLGQSQPPFYFRMVSDIYDVSEDNDWLSFHYDTLAKEYKFWMTQRISPNGLNYYGPTAKKELTPERIEHYYAYFASRFDGFSTDDFALKTAAAHTITTLCESGWDCCSRFGIDGPFYNPVDLNSLLYGLESTMARFSKILGRGEESLWSDRAQSRKEKMDKFLFCKEKGIYLDWNFRDEKHSSVVSVASYVPYFVGMEADPEKAMQILQTELLLPFGVSCCVPSVYPYPLQWDYPNVWAPLQYIAYISCINCGYKDLALSIAERYMKLLETDFAKTHNLWEKYNGITGQVVNAEYTAPPMLGWTAGIYLAFCRAVGREF